MTSTSPTFVTRWLLARFKAKYTIYTYGCWIWNGAVQSKGRPSMGDGLGSSILAARWAYEQVKTPKHTPRPIPSGLVLPPCAHSLLCVNPEHLTPAPKSMNARKTHCKYGHPLSGDNLIIRKDGSGRRRCRTCDYARNRVYEKAHRRGSKYGNMTAPETSVDTQLVATREAEQKKRDVHAARMRELRAAATRAEEQSSAPIVPLLDV